MPDTPKSRTARPARRRAPRKTVTLVDAYHLLAYDILYSTNEEAKRLAHAGALHGAVIWSRIQESGKGRNGNVWLSPEGNLYISLLLSPTKQQTAWSQLSIVTALAVRDTLASILDESVHQDLLIKWPNDIVYRDAKIAGLLLESFHANQKDWVVIGMGINVENCPDPSQVRFAAASLHAAGIEIISPKIVLSRLVYHFIKRYDAWESGDDVSEIMQEYSSYLYGMGRQVHMHCGDQQITGVFESVDSHGHIQLRVQDGSLQSYPSGEMQHLVVS